MLFPVHSRLQNVRLIGAKVTTAATPSFAVDLNPDEFVAPTRTGTGAFTLPLRQSSSRILQMFGTPNSPSSSFDGGSIFSPSVASEKASIQGVLSGTSGTATEGSGNLIIASATSSVIDRVKLNPVLGCKRQQGVIFFGDITITAGTVTINKGSGDFTAVRTGSGAATITFKRQVFGQAPIVIAQAISNGAFFGSRVANVTTTGFDVQLSNSVGSPPASDRLNFMVYGFSAKDTYGGAESPLMSTQRGMRLELYRIVGGALTIGSQLGTVSGGAGDYTVTFREPFRQKPFVFTGAANATVKGMHQNLPTTTAVQSYNFTYPTTLANSTAQDILVIGSDDPSEY
jgi:hypothetical protein